MGVLSSLRCLGLAFSSPILTHTSLSPQNPPPQHHHPLESPLTPRDFLAELPPGPYTCMRGRGLALLGFDYHMDRLCEGIRAAGVDVDHQQQQGGDGLRGRVLGSLESCIMGVLRRASSGYDVTDEFDTFVTLHAHVTTNGGGGGVEVSAHAYPLPFVKVPEAVTIEVRGEGRARPEIKHSQWLRDREPLERYRIGSGGEVVLSRPASSSQQGGRELLEGLVTNLMVVQHDGTLWTAGDGVLKGHIRHMLLQAAREFGVKVVEKAPLLEDMENWHEVFITGSGRLIVPVNKIQGSTFGIPTTTFHNTPGPLTNQLRQRLLYDIAKSWVPIDTLRSSGSATRRQQQQQGEKGVGGP